MPDSVQHKKAVPICTAAAPKVRDSAIVFPSIIPPAAITGFALETSNNPTTKYGIARVDSANDTKYYGFLDKDSNWYVMQEVTSTGVFLYTVPVATSFATGWSGRAGLSYVEFNTAF